MGRVSRWANVVIGFVFICDVDVVNDDVHQYMKIDICVTGNSILCLGRQPNPSHNVITGGKFRRMVPLRQLERHPAGRVETHLRNFSFGIHHGH